MQVGVYGPRQNLRRNIVITFSFNNCFRQSYSKMCKNITDSGRHNYSDVSMLSFEHLTLFIYKCGKLYMHHCLLKIEENDGFWRCNGPKNSNEFMRRGRNDTHTTLKQMQSTDSYKNESKQLVYKLHGRLSNGWTDSSHGRWPPCKDKNQTLAVKTVIESDRRKTVR